MKPSIDMAAGAHSAASHFNVVKGDVLIPSNLVEDHRRVHRQENIRDHDTRAGLPRSVHLRPINSHIDVACGCIHPVRLGPPRRQVGVLRHFTRK